MPHPSVRKLAAAIAGPPAVAVPVTFATGEVLFSLTTGEVSVQTAGGIFLAPYYGARPPQGATVGILFADGSPIILGVPHGPAPLTP
jgi:hypothetical protein